MNYNSVISVRDISDDSGSGPAEPVTRDEFKDYARLRGFVDLGDSPPTDIGNFSFDDLFIDMAITAARQLMEEKLGISIIFHTWEVWLNNLSGRILIPYGPIIGIWYVKDTAGNILAATTEGSLWVYLVTPALRPLIVTYNAGYGDINTVRLPKGIKLDVLRLAYYWYINRGDDTSVEQFASEISRKYAMKTPIA